MVNNKRLLILFLVIIVSFVFYWLHFKFTSNRIVPTQESRTTESTNYPSNEVKEVKYRDDFADQKVDIVYPQLIGKHYDSEDISSINSDIKKIVDSELKTFRLGFREYNSNTGEFAYPSAIDSDIQNTFYMSYKIINLTDDFLSVEINSEMYFREAANPMRSTSTYDYDFKKHKQINIQN